MNLVGQIYKDKPWVSALVESFRIDYKIKPGVSASGGFMRTDKNV